MAAERATRKKHGFWYGVAVAVVKPLLLVTTRRDWRGAEHIPAEGGFLVVANHISYVDPLVYAHFQHERGRPPRFMAKASLFTLPVLGKFLHRIGQIPVHRGSREAAMAFRDAVAALEAGEGVVVYAEGTITKDPDVWPMAAKTGAARIALSAKVPVIPVAQWGAHRILPVGSVLPRLFPPKRVHILAGPPVDLSDLEGRATSAKALREATERIMAAITAQLEQLRGEKAPGAGAEQTDAEAAAASPAAAAADVVGSDAPAADAPAADDANSHDANPEDANPEDARPDRPNATEGEEDPGVGAAAQGSVSQLTETGGPTAAASAKGER